jgi:hypothetical protein
VTPLGLSEEAALKAFNTAKSQPLSLNCFNCSKVLPVTLQDLAQHSECLVPWEEIETLAKKPLGKKRRKGSSVSKKGKKKKRGPSKQQPTSEELSAASESKASRARRTRTPSAKLVTAVALGTAEHKRGADGQMDTDSDEGRPAAARETEDEGPCSSESGDD